MINDMKKTIFLVLSLMLTIVIKAGDVTPEQAQQQARRFLQQRVTSGVSKNRSQAVAELKMAGRVSGLYVFNATGDNGYVIVSNDDRTESVLGYSDNGRLDMDNMPENLRAWLQGYADEIAWLDAHGWQPSASSAPRRASAVKPPIAPLMKTHWNQDAPYHNLCPYYKGNSYNTIGGDGYEHCATGCVATAMAQVMYYNQWPAEPTAAIPAYEWSGASITLGGLPATTFDWANMQLSYSGSESDEQNTAVATLMRYCGQSLEMDYGPSSSASTSDIPEKLKTYFNYASTAQYLGRNQYTYAHWIDLIYHEFAENRVVVYRGSSSGGGHAFICDGYEGEDYFHFNWGWGGTSDGYYQLSVTNPYDQGIGGSSTKDGFWIGQGAIVGIQKQGGTGTVLDVAKGDFDLSATIDAVSASPTQNQNVNVTVTVSNAGSDPYDGEIGLEVYYYNGETWKYESDTYKHLSVPAGGNASGTFTFVPEHAGKYFVRPFQNFTPMNYLCLDREFTVAAGSPSAPTTDNITLTSELTSVDNSYIEGGNHVFYVSASNATLKATITVTNPDATNAYKGYYEWMLCRVLPDWASITYSSNEYTIAPSGNLVIPVEVSGLTEGATYRLQVVYVKNGDWTDWAYFDTYLTKPGLVNYDANGTQTIAKPAGTTYNVPASAVAVDLSGTGVTTVNKNSNPNCLYILKSTDAVPAGLTNVITTNGAANTAASITLTDGYDFYSPVNFTATNIEFTYANDRWADGTNGWNTIMLPFDVTDVTANGTAIDWFHHSTDYGKNFWLKEFVSDDTTAPKVNFDYAAAMKANTPYIIALPGSHWGTENDLSGKTIKFIATDAEVKKSVAAVVTGSNYRFVGNTRAVTTENIYCINDAGNKFELQATGGSPAFRAYFKADIFDRSVDALGIGSGIGGTTEINEVRGKTEEVRDSYYDLSGRRLDKQPTAKGIYIHHGVKVVIK